MKQPYFYCLLDESCFSGICTIIELNELNWLCKHMKNFRRNQPCILMNFCTELSSSMWVSLNRKSIAVQMIFKTAHHLKEWHVFMLWTFECFQYFNFETNFQKTGVPIFVKSTNIKDANFPYKLILSEANINTNRMRSTKWIYDKKRSFACDDFGFLNVIFFQYKILL